MKALLQRVKKASVKIDGNVVGEINEGLLVFLGVNKSDTHAVCQRMVDKVLLYRVFADKEGKMNLNLKDVSGALLVISQFTLVADTRKGLRPSFSSAGSPESSEVLYDEFIESARTRGVLVQSGQFGADMQVSLMNDGPVTFMLELD